MRLLIIVLIFFILSSLLIITNNDLALYDKENFGKFSDLYTEWINQIYINGQLITGEIIKMQWWPDNLQPEIR